MALASFASNAFSFTLGFPLLTGAAVRYWIYGRAALPAARIAEITLVVSLTFWLGMAGVLGLGLVLPPLRWRRSTICRPRRIFASAPPCSACLEFYCGWATLERSRPAPLGVGFGVGRAESRAASAHAWRRRYRLRRGGAVRCCCPPESSGSRLIPGIAQNCHAHCRRDHQPRLRPVLFRVNRLSSRILPEALAIFPGDSRYGNRRCAVVINA